MGKTELLEDTAAPELELDEWDEPDLDDFGAELDELESLSSDIDRWDVEEEYDSYSADRAYLYGLLR
jgi:hypothetical protein